jgi:hypothetical protein
LVANIDVYCENRLVPATTNVISHKKVQLASKETLLRALRAKLAGVERTHEDEVNGILVEKKQRISELRVLTANNTASLLQQSRTISDATYELNTHRKLLLLLCRVIDNLKSC